MGDERVHPGHEGAPGQSPNVITTKNVSSLQQMWAGQAGVVAVGSSKRLSSPMGSPTSCRTVSTRSRPTATAVRPGARSRCGNRHTRRIHQLSRPGRGPRPSPTEWYTWSIGWMECSTPTRSRVERPAQQCEPLWTFQLGEPPSQSAPIVQGSTLYVASSPGSTRSRRHAHTRAVPRGPVHTRAMTGGRSTPQRRMGSCSSRMAGSSGRSPTHATPRSAARPGSLSFLRRTSTRPYRSPSIAESCTSAGKADPPVARRRQGLYAFDEACGTGGATCRPLWSWTNASGQVVASNGVVYVQSGGKFLGFPERCGAGGATCEPSRVPRAASWGLRRVFESTGAPIVKSWQGAIRDRGRGRRVRRGLPRALARSRSTPRAGPPGSKWCPYLWTATTPGWSRATPTVAEGKIYVATGNSKIVAFGLSTPEPAPSGGGGSMRWVLFAVGAGLLIGSVWAVALRRTRERIREGHTR